MRLCATFTSNIRSRTSLSPQQDEQPHGGSGLLRSEWRGDLLEPVSAGTPCRLIHGLLAQLGHVPSNTRPPLNSCARRTR